MEARKHSPIQFYSNPYSSNSTLSLSSKRSLEPKSRIGEYFEKKLKDKSLSDEQRRKYELLLDKKRLYENGDNTTILEPSKYTSLRRNAGMDNVINRNTAKREAYYSNLDGHYDFSENYVTPRELLRNTELGREAKLDMDSYNAIMNPQSLSSSDIDRASTNIVNSMDPQEKIRKYTTEMNKKTKAIRKLLNKNIKYNTVLEDIENFGGVGNAIARGRTPVSVDSNGVPILQGKNPRNYTPVWGTMANVPEEKINEWILAGSNGELDLNWFKQNGEDLARLSPSSVYYTSLVPLTSRYAKQKIFGTGDAVTFGNINNVKNILERHDLGLGEHHAMPIAQFETLLRNGALKKEGIPLNEAMYKYNRRSLSDGLGLAISSGYETKIPENLLPDINATDKVVYNMGKMPSATPEEILKDPHIQLKKWMDYQNSLPVNKRAFSINLNDAYNNNLGGIINSLKNLNNDPALQRWNNFISSLDIKRNYANEAFNPKSDVPIPSQLKAKYMDNYIKLLKSIQEKYNNTLPEVVDNRKRKWNAYLNNIINNRAEEYANSPYLNYFTDQAYLHRNRKY